MTIAFDFTATTVQLLGGTVNIPPDGAILAATGLLTVDATSLSSPTPGGSAVLSALVIDTSVAASPIGQSVTGSVTTTQNGTATGIVSPGLGNVELAADSLAFDLSGGLDCAGPLCNLIGDFPVVLGGTETVAGIVSLAVLGLDTPGIAAVSASWGLNLDGLNGVFDLSGVETSRSFVPEPSTASLLLLGLGAIAARRRGCRAQRLP
ncbi:MAG: PEP-CTERM sorting domain-containing protein, partial [Deltaproteobacteria bacterium]|nr:PEP-CTERM sorting domain-containing protein [Deltaproteobacteria bacterium]